jgi:hypothetical protein
MVELLADMNHLWNTCLSTFWLTQLCSFTQTTQAWSPHHSSCAQTSLIGSYMCFDNIIVANNMFMVYTIKPKKYSFHVKSCLMEYLEGVEYAIFNNKVICLAFWCGSIFYLPRSYVNETHKNKIWHVSFILEFREFWVARVISFS